MGHKDIEEKAEKLLSGLMAGTDIELVDVEYVRERNWILRLFIDKEGGVDLNDCQIISEKAGQILDKADFMGDNYLLEVSSPGLDRVLKKDRDFVRYAGHDVDVRMFAPVNGQKEMTVRLEGITPDGKLRFTGEDGQEQIIEKDKISQVKLHFSF